MQTEVASMSDKIKKFFAKKKADAKFKMAGPGHKLTDDGSSGSSYSAQQSKGLSANIKKRVEPTKESELAARAALSRLSTQTRSTPLFNTSLQAVRNQVKRELEMEKQAALCDIPQPKDPVVHDVVSSPHLVATGVYFKCPLISDAVLTRAEWKANIKEFLYEQLAEERGLTACLIIQSCNSNREKVADCVQTLCKYLENIINNPTDEKYQKIRMSNRVFAEKVQPIEGAMELLFAAGFELKEVRNQEDQKEQFLVYEPDEEIHLEALIDGLRTVEPIEMELDRNVHVLLPSQAAKKTELPPSFYAISPEEIKREHQNRLEAIEKSQMLRTKAMREKDEQREMRKYLFAVIRVRFPDGILLQGTFYVNETVKEVFEFVQEHLELEENIPFQLNDPTGRRLNLEEDAEKTLVEVKLVPATILTFCWDPQIADDMNNSEMKDIYLKPEVMLLVRE